MKRIGALAVGMMFTAMASTVSAQSVKPITFGIKAGATIPTSDLSNAAGTGWHVGGLMGLQPAGMPLSFRLEAEYHGFGSKTISSYKEQPKLFDVTGNAIYTFPASGTVRPYVIGGLGYYHFDASCTPSCGSAVNKFGLNGGAGIEMELSGFNTFIEARYHGILNALGPSGSTKAAQMVPISFGIRF